MTDAAADLLAMAEDELARAVTLSWRALSKVVPWGDGFGGITPGGRDVTVERAYLWRAGAGGDILCEVAVFQSRSGNDGAVRVEAVIGRPPDAA